jgi:hypothetical protein
MAGCTPFLRKGVWVGAQIVDELDPGVRDIHVTEQRFGCFWDPELGQPPA